VRPRLTAAVSIHDAAALAAHTRRAPNVAGAHLDDGPGDAHTRDAESVTVSPNFRSDGMGSVRPGTASVQIPKRLRFKDGSLFSELP
jgi:hypothetical protein